MFWSRPFYILMAVLLLISVGTVNAQTTGSIAGVVIEKNTGDPIPGANIFADGAAIGAASDDDGHFFIINVPPGLYTMNVEVIGYNNFKVLDLRVSVNRTAYIKAELVPAVLEGETIVVVASKISEKKECIIGSDRYFTG